MCRRSQGPRHSHQAIRPSGPRAQGRQRTARSAAARRPRYRDTRRQWECTRNEQIRKRQEPDYFSYIAGGLKVFLDHGHIAKSRDPARLEGKPYGLLYSHGGGGAVKGPMERQFRSLGEQVGKTVESVGSPGKAALGNCRELGQQLARGGD